MFHLLYLNRNYIIFVGKYIYCFVMVCLSLQQLYPADSKADGTVTDLNLNQKVSWNKNSVAV